MRIIDRTIVALDNMNKGDILDFLDRTNGEFRFVKIGMELFYKEGRNIVMEIHDKYKVEIFLDLKLHDIPNTVKKAIKSLSGLPVKFLTVHLAGGEKMLKEAILEAQTSLQKTNLLGVSFLTSLSANDFTELFDYDEKKTKEAFERFFKVACKAKIHGVILSPHELELCRQIERQSGHELLKITPGIRFQDEINSGNTQDQARVLSPQSAIQNGADYLVIGRSLTMADNIEKRIIELKENI
ncbi:MAG: orotidine-5'-phosphate decarboxylase [Bacteriovoracaceae bacterium]|nr:orotidine-5'-phosphate decarboxylase [Bacteriovoracaceae bacterium]